MTTTPTVRFTADSLRVVGLTVGQLRAALSALAVDPDLAAAPAAGGLFAECAAIELRAQGLAVAVEAAPGTRLRHTCGAAFAAAEWAMRPTTRHPILTVGGAESWFEARNCTCGSTLTYAGLEVF